MAILKHIKSRNANYSDAIDYLLFHHDGSTGKKIKDEMGRSLLRDEFYMDDLNCDSMSFDKECKLTNANTSLWQRNWSGQYPSAMNRWHDNWDAISPIFKFSKDVRTAFYTTNAIESLNSCYRRLNKQRSVFPSSQALMKALYLGTFEIAKKWTMSTRN